MQLIRRAGGSLCCRIEPPQALDRVADELDAHRRGVGRRKYIDNATAHGKGAVLVHWILTRETCIHEQVRQALWLDFRPWSELARRPQQTLARTHARQQRRRGRDDHACRSRRCGVQGSRPGRRHAEMRCHASIRIDLKRGKREYGLLDCGRRRALERPIEEARVGCHLLDISISRDNEQCQRACSAGRMHRGQCLTCRGETGGHLRAAERRQDRGLPQ